MFQTIGNLSVSVLFYPLIAVCLYGTILLTLRSIAPSTYFNWHFKRLKKGKFRIKQAGELASIQTLFAKVTVFPVKEKGHLLIVRGKGNEFIRMTYDPQKRVCQDVLLSAEFLKGFKTNDLDAFMADYASHVLKACGGIETETFVWQPLHVQTSSEAIATILDEVNQLALELQPDMPLLDPLNQHDFELLYQRISELLFYTKSHEQEVVDTLQEVREKLQSWQVMLDEKEQRQFEKKRSLIETITKR